MTYFGRVLDEALDYVEVGRLFRVFAEAAAQQSDYVKALIGLERKLQDGKIKPEKALDILRSMRSRFGDLDAEQLKEKQQEIKHQVTLGAISKKRGQARLEELQDLYVGLPMYNRCMRMITGGRKPSAGPDDGEGEQEPWEEPLKEFVKAAGSPQMALHIIRRLVELVD